MKKSIRFLFILFPLAAFAGTPNDDLIKAVNQGSDNQVRKSIKDGATNLDEALKVALRKNPTSLSYQIVYDLFDYGAKLGQVDAEKIKQELSDKLCSDSKPVKDILGLLVKQGYGPAHTDWKNMMAWSKSKERINCGFDLDAAAGILDDKKLNEILAIAKENNNEVLEMLANERIANLNKKMAEYNSDITILMKCDTADTVAKFRQDKLELNIGGKTFDLKRGAMSDRWSGDKINFNKKSDKEYSVSFEKGVYLKTYINYNCTVIKE
ncbi:MAG: hypothetical protein LBJ18_00955 [Rickettsiales bacterium]|jgi:hypothetical protein|nr:hypothetical protein [Rickettsiales bacterium]